MDKKTQAKKSVTYPLKVGRISLTLVNKSLFTNEQTTEHDESPIFSLKTTAYPFFIFLGMNTKQKGRTNLSLPAPGKRNRRGLVLFADMRYNLA